MKQINIATSNVIYIPIAYAANSSIYVYSNRFFFLIHAHNDELKNSLSVPSLSSAGKAESSSNRSKDIYPLKWIFS